MSDDASLDLLIAQLQIRMPDLGSLLVTSPGRSGLAEAVARRIVRGLRERDIKTMLYVSAGSDDGGRGAAETGNAAPGALHGGEPCNQRFTSAQAGSPSLARRLLNSSGAVTVAAAPGILEDPAALFLASAADGVLLVAQSGRTTRSDLKRARLEIETAGGVLVGAVLSQ